MAKLGRILKFGTILESDLSEKVTKHPLWEGSILQQRMKLEILNISDIRVWLDERGKVPDLTESENDLFHALVEVSESWERSFEF